MLVKSVVISSGLTLPGRMHYQLSELPNGLRIITEAMPAVRSIALGLWVDTGTRDEQPPEAGASHFLEHLLFKGSERYSARYIAETFDSIGAESNAFTSKDNTCFWGRLLDRDLPVGLDLLAEMLQRPAFRPHEIDSERQVVIEEINMNEDDPSDVAFEEFTKAVFAGHPLEMPVLGTRDSIRGMSRADLQGYWARRYGPSSTVLAMAGSINHDEAVDLATKLLGDWAGEANDHKFGPSDTPAAVRMVHRETEQAHLVIGGTGLDRFDERRFAFDILNHVLGGGMSSRLFLKIREERGLAYAVYSFRLAHADTGAWGVYVGTTPDQAETCLGLIEEEINAVVEDGITDEELERAKGNMRGGLAISMEDANSRMIRLGRDELNGAPHLSIDERLARLDAVSATEVVTVARAVLRGRRVMGAVGPFKQGDLDRWVA
ncbi:MAG TPA: pitrilysin family protein [Acidimicrobiia bacterium]|nr:pitrilysin family protein [Acidimicrobiia bacterium]